MTKVEHQYADEIGANPEHGYLEPMSKIPDMDLNLVTQEGLGDYAGAPPIDVPRPKVGAEGHWTIGNGYHENGMYQNASHEKSCEEYMRNRRLSIKFSPEVTLDSGDTKQLEEPLPKLSLDPRPIDKVALKEQEKYPRWSSIFQRTHSETDIRNYDSITGKDLGRHPSIFDAHQEFSPDSPFQPNHPSTPSPRPELESLNTDQAVSLTSDLTISPILEEIHTPQDNMELLMSPISTFPPFAYPTSYEDSSAWPKQRKRTSSRPIFQERSMSMRSSRRQSSGRSTMSPMSPATSFLSRFASTRERSPDPDDEGQVVGEYVLGKQVAFGGFSVVKEAFTIEGDAKVLRAAKILRKQIVGKDEAENDTIQAEFEHEVEIWRCLAHRHIIPLIEVYDTPFATFCFTKLNTGGTLFDLVRANRQGLSANLARRYAYQLASAIQYLHEDVRIVHRDIKLENCLIDTSDPSTASDGGNLLLCDFGLAEFIPADSSDPFAPRTASQPFPTASHPLPSSSQQPIPHSTSFPTTAANVPGTLNYASPELLLSPSHFLSPVTDIWAFGVVIYTLLVGSLPFTHVFQPRVQMMILAGEWDVNALESSHGARGWEDEVVEFVQGCLDMRTTEEEGRWTVGQVLGSRWLRGMQEMLEEGEGGFKL